MVGYTSILRKSRTRRASVALFDTGPVQPGDLKQGQPKQNIENAPFDTYGDSPLNIGNNLFTPISSPLIMPNVTTTQCARLLDAAQLDDAGAKKPLCDNETLLYKCDCRCDPQDNTSLSGEQAKLVFCAAVWLLCTSMILFPYMIRYLMSVNKKPPPKEPDRSADEADPHNDMPSWLCYLNAFGAGCFLSVSLLEFIPIVVDRTPEALGFPLGIFSIGIGFLTLALMEHIEWSFLCGGCSGNKNDARSMQRARSKEGIYTSNQDVPLNGIEGPSDQEVAAMLMPQSEMPRSNYSTYSLAAQPRTPKEVKAAGFRRVLKLTLSFIPHAFMVGIAVGMGSSWYAIRGILIGIVPHKVILNLSLGVQYLHSKIEPMKATIIAVIFASVMPVGVFAGHLFIHSIEDDSKKTKYLPIGGCNLELGGKAVTEVECILQGIGAGTIFFVTFCELLPGELDAKEHAKQRAIMVVIGYFVMSSLALLEEGDE